MANTFGMNLTGDTSIFKTPSTIYKKRAAANANTGPGFTNLGIVKQDPSMQDQSITDPSANYVDPAAQKAAADAALVAQRKGDIGGKLTNYNNMFSGLFGSIDAAGADQALTTNENYSKQRTGLTDEYNQSVPGIDMSYYLGGVGDSSLRLAGLGRAEAALQAGIGQVDANEQNDLSQIGQYTATKKAGYMADQANIENIRNSVEGSTDANELLQLQNEIATKISGLTADEAGFKTGGQYRADLAAATPTKDLSPIKSTLTSLVQGAANPALKRQIATQIIDNAGLGEKQKADLYAEFVNSVTA